MNAEEALNKLVFEQVPSMLQAQAKLEANVGSVKDELERLRLLEEKVTQLRIQAGIIGSIAGLGGSLLVKFLS